MKHSSLRVEGCARRQQAGKALRPACSRRCQPQSVPSGRQLAQVVADGVERPLAMGAVTAAQAELSGVLADLHLSEGRLDDRLAPGVVGAALLRPQLPRHALAPGGVLRDRSARCLRELLAVALAPGGGEDLGVERFGRLEVVLRAVTGIREV